MSNVIFQKLVSDFVMKNKALLSLYMIVIVFTWPAEAILLSRKYSDLVTSLRQRVDIKKLFNFGDNIKEGNVFGVLLLILFIWIGLIVFYRIKYTLEQQVFPVYMSHIRQTLVTNILKSNSNDYKDIKSGEYIAIINELTHVFLGMVEKVTGKFLPLFVGVISITIYYFIIHPYIGLTFSILSLIRGVFNYQQGMDYARSCAIRDKSYFDLNEHINDTFNNSMNIHLNNTMKFEEKKGKKMNDKYDLEQEEEMRVRKNIIWKSNLITILCFVMIIVIAYYLYMKKKVSLPLLLTIAFIEIKLVGTFIEFDSLSLQFFQRFGTVIATNDFLRDVLSNSDEKAKTCNTTKAGINVKNMSFRYDDKSPYIFKDMNLHVKPGERVGLIGRSGSGKTTLMKVLLGLHKYTSGKITIGDCNINNMSNEKLRENVVYINQKTQLFNQSVLKNIQYGNDHLSEETILKYLKKHNLEVVFSGLEKGIYSSAGVNGSMLSLGMQKVTMILRGVFKKGNILIFDEPLAGLDKKTKEKVIQIINSISRSKTIIVVTHDNEILSYLDKVYKLEDLHKKK